MLPPGSLGGSQQSPSTPPPSSACEWLWTVCAAETRGRGRTQGDDSAVDKTQLRIPKVMQMTVTSASRGSSDDSHSLSLSLRPNRPTERRKIRHVQMLPGASVFPADSLWRGPAPSGRSPWCPCWRRWPGCRCRSVWSCGMWRSSEGRPEGSEPTEVKVSNVQVTSHAGHFGSSKESELNYCGWIFFFSLVRHFNGAPSRLLLLMNNYPPLLCLAI